MDFVYFHTLIYIAWQDVKSLSHLILKCIIFKNSVFKDQQLYQGSFLQLSWAPQKKTRMGPSSQCFDSLPTCCMWSSHEDCSVDDNYLVQVWMSCHRVCTVTISPCPRWCCSCWSLCCELCCSCCRHICEAQIGPGWERHWTRGCSTPPCWWPCSALCTLQRLTMKVFGLALEVHVCMDRNGWNWCVVFPENCGQKLLPLHTTNPLFRWRWSCAILTFFVEVKIWFQSLPA